MLQGHLPTPAFGTATQSCAVGHQIHFQLLVDDPDRATYGLTSKKKSIHRRLMMLDPYPTISQGVDDDDDDYY